MGWFFSNIQLRVSALSDMQDLSRIAGVMAKGQNLTWTDNADDADGEVTMIVSEGSPWITVMSDLVDGDLEMLLLRARELSDAMQTQALAIACFDSDYLCLNMIDVKKKVDIWAASGCFPYGKVPRRSAFSPWGKYVSDLERFKQVMRADRLCAEDCLTELESLLSLPVLQSQSTVGDVPDDDGVHHYYYKFNEEQDAGVPQFSWFRPSVYYHADGKRQHVSFINRGAASKGVAVVVTGPCIAQHQVQVKSVEIQCRNVHGEYRFIPVQMEEWEFSGGIAGLYGKYPDLRIPPAVPEGIPPKKRMDMEFQRCILVCVAVTPDPHYKGNEFGDLQVSLIPLKNSAGQCGWVMKRESDCAICW